MDVPEARQYGVHDQREHQAHDRRHETEQEDDVLPTAAGFVGRGGWCGIRDAHERMQVGGLLWLGCCGIIHAVFDVRYAFAVVFKVKVAVRAQNERAFHHYSLRTIEF